MVVGIGSSAADVAVEISRCAEKVRDAVMCNDFYLSFYSTVGVCCMLKMV